MAKNIAAAVEQLALPVAQGLGLEIWDVEFVKEGADYFLRVFIDKPEGVSIEDCEQFSRAFDPVLDEADPVDKAYCFEVSSPGIERELTRPEHFEKLKGQEIRVCLYRPKDGKKEFIGTLISGGDEVIIESDNEQLKFSKQDCAAVRLRGF